MTSCKRREDTLCWQLTLLGLALRPKPWSDRNMSLSSLKDRWGLESPDPSSVSMRLAKSQPACPDVSLSHQTLSPWVGGELRVWQPTLMRRCLKRYKWVYRLTWGFYLVLVSIWSQFLSGPGFYLVPVSIWSRFLSGPGFTVSWEWKW